MKKGIRQGDLLSSSLFNIVVEGLTIFFGKTRESDLYSEVNISSQIVTLFPYANDTVIFYLNDMETLKNIKIILNWFWLCLSLKVNFHKIILIGINVDLEFTKRVIDSLRCKSSCFLINYLRIPLGENLRLCSTWKPVLEKIKSYPRMWKDRILSVGGRLCLLKSDMSLFKIPSSVAKKIISIQRWFLRSRDMNKQSICKVLRIS